MTIDYRDLLKKYMAEVYRLAECTFILNVDIHGEEYSELEKIAIGVAREANAASAAEPNVIDPEWAPTPAQAQQVWESLRNLCQLYPEPEPDYSSITRDCSGI